MAYDGGVDFLDLPLGGVDWLKDAIKSPWESEGVDSWHTGDGKEYVELKAWARPFALGSLVPTTAEDKVVILYDNQDLMNTEDGNPMCVVVGRTKNKNMTAEELVYFVLVIKSSKGASDAKDGSKSYERVGVGHMKGKFLDLKSSAQAVVIR